jgi:glycosyltransferase involved in cell wall biosynthesis
MKQQNQYPEVTPYPTNYQLAPVSQVWYGGTFRAVAGASQVALPASQTIPLQVVSQTIPFQSVSQTIPFSFGPTSHAAKPLRVIHVGQCLLRAGIESWLKALIRNSDPRKLQVVRCVVASDQFDPSVAAELGVPIEVGGPESVRRAARDCDVLLISGPPECGDWLTDSPPKLCLFVAHGDGHWTRNVLLGCAPRVDHVVAVSRRVQEMTCEGFPTTVILNGVDASHVICNRPRNDVRAAHGFGPDDFVLGFVGRFSQEKCPELLIRAVSLLPSRFKALLVGWGSMRPALMDEANELIPGRYAFAYGPQVGDFFNAMDAFCLTSEYEGFGLVTIEAMMCKRPVISRRVGFAPECLTDRIHCVMVDGSPESFAQAAQLLAQHGDWATSVASEGFRFAERNGHASRMCREYETLIARLFAAKHGAVPS